jgi:hypothetical protein
VAAARANGHHCPCGQHIRCPPSQHRPSKPASPPQPFSTAGVHRFGAQQAVPHPAGATAEEPGCASPAARTPCSATVVTASTRPVRHRARRNELLRRRRSPSRECASTVLHGLFVNREPLDCHGQSHFAYESGVHGCRLPDPPAWRSRCDAEWTSRPFHVHRSAIRSFPMVQPGGGSRSSNF